MNVGIIGQTNELIGFANAIKNSVIVTENLFSFVQKRKVDVFLTNGDHFSRPLFKVCKRNKIPIIIFSDDVNDAKIQQAINAKIDINVIPTNYSVCFDDIRFNPEKSQVIEFYKNKKIWIPCCHQPLTHYFAKNLDKLLILSSRRVNCPEYHGWPNSDSQLQNIIYSAEECCDWGYNAPNYMYYLQIGCGGRGFTLSKADIPTYTSSAKQIGIL